MTSPQDDYEPIPGSYEAAIRRLTEAAKVVAVHFTPPFIQRALARGATLAPNGQGNPQKPLVMEAVECTGATPGGNRSAFDSLDTPGGGR